MGSQAPTTLHTGTIFKVISRRTLLRPPTAVHLASRYLTSELGLFSMPSYPLRTGPERKHLCRSPKVRVLLKNRKSKIYKGTVTSKVDAKFCPQITPREVPCDADEDKLSHGDKVAKKTDKLGNEMLHITLKDGTVVEAQEWGVAVAPSEAGVKKQRCRKSAAKAKGEALAHAAANGTASLLEEMEVDC